MTGNELLKVILLKAIRTALPCPYGTSVDVRVDDNGDVHIEMILLKLHQPFNLEDEQKRECVKCKRCKWYVNYQSYQWCDRHDTILPEKPCKFFAELHPSET